MLGYYIYYRVEAAHAAALEHKIREMQASLAAETGIPGRLMKKRGEPLLWMEVYEGVEHAERFARALERLVRDHFVTDALQPGGQRHAECFEQ